LALLRVNKNAIVYCKLFLHSLKLEDPSNVITSFTSTYSSDFYVMI